MCGVYMEFTNKASKELKVYIEGNPVAVGELRDLSFDMGAREALSIRGDTTY